MEGVMMKYKNNYAVAVRKPDHEIIVETRTYHGICKNETLRNFIFIRGIINFIESMILGMSTLTFSASFFEEEQCEEEKPKNEKKEKAQMGITSLVCNTCRDNFHGASFLCVLIFPEIDFVKDDGNFD